MVERNQDSISLNKFISNTGRCSRREADRLIDEGVVKLNEVVAKKGNRVFKDDKVSIHGELIGHKLSKRIYIAFNKPIGIVCTTDTMEKDNIISFINYPKRIFPIGRIDKPSEGLILLTDDGDIVNKILRAGNNHEKEYIVGVDSLITNNFIQQMANGLPILGTRTKKCKVEKLGAYSFKIILIQGLNRQIRRMCSYLNYEVTSLKRVRIMNIHLNGLPVGKWRDLTENEMKLIEKQLEHSVKN